jgi:hypothetical protein
MKTLMIGQLWITKLSTISEWTSDTQLVIYKIIDISDTQEYVVLESAYASQLRDDCGLNHILVLESAKFLGEEKWTLFRDPRLQLPLQTKIPDLESTC